MFVISIFEVFSVFSFQSPIAGGEPWTIRTDHYPGDFGFDPLSLKPTDALALKEMQTKVRAAQTRFGRRDLDSNACSQQPPSSRSRRCSHSPVLLARRSSTMEGLR